MSSDGHPDPQTTNIEDIMSDTKPTHTYRNTDESFGWVGPFEAESREALADEMMPSFEEWVNDAYGHWLQDAEEGEEFDRSGWIAQTREEFIAALDEVEA